MRRKKASRGNMVLVGVMDERSPNIFHGTCAKLATYKQKMTGNWASEWERSLQELLA